LVTGSCVLRETRIVRGWVARFSIYRARDRRGSRARATGRAPGGDGVVEAER
jgi:hypothetical protein